MFNSNKGDYFSNPQDRFNCNNILPQNRRRGSHPNQQHLHNPHHPIDTNLL